MIKDLIKIRRLKICKKYVFSKIKHCHTWFYLPVDLSNIILCEIEGAGTTFQMDTVFFVREESPEDEVKRRIKERKWSDTDLLPISACSSGGKESIPISRDAPTMILPLYADINGYSFVIADSNIDMSSRACKMLQGEESVQLSVLSIPFSDPSFIHGAYICVSKKYEFVAKRKDPYLSWYFLPIDFDNVVLCELRGKSTNSNFMDFTIESLAFVRKETSEEQSLREAQEFVQSRLWADPAIRVEPIFLSESNFYKMHNTFPIIRDAPTFLSANFSEVKSKDESKCRMSKSYDQSDSVRKMLNGEELFGSVTFSYLSIPFSSCVPMKGAYIQIDQYLGCSLFLFIFTHSDGTKTFKTYEFTQPKRYNEWYFLPIDLSDVVCCEIKGKGSWKEERRRSFKILGLDFIREETLEESKNRCQIEESWSEIPLVKAEFSCNGKEVPKLQDDEEIVEPHIPTVKARNGMLHHTAKEYDVTLRAQDTLQGQTDVGLTNIFIPFSSPTALKGKKFEIPESKEFWEWYFLRFELFDVVSCEIQSIEGTWGDFRCPCFILHYIPFIRERFCCEQKDEILRMEEMTDESKVDEGES
ncbi:hypothetical protein ADUPG1_010512 [Aduncisulcus paluster]|uniref:Uncharacterized protein n=1 Tax=Aduncisulcus paluster TaxID=2918883 RepID=A0ABQ5JRP6_9EUKA|nr:hypothetical protein ADUPG1_010512 [Aduncisulcus paluster]